VRDYVHITDLAKGHVAALEHLSEACKFEAYNLGTGQGVSVLELIKAFEEASGRTIAYRVVDRRPGDIATAFANADKAANELGWRAQKSILDACVDEWRWQSNNPRGYDAA